MLDLFNPVGANVMQLRTSLHTYTRDINVPARNTLHQRTITLSHIARDGLNLSFYLFSGIVCSMKLGLANARDPV